MATKITSVKGNVLRLAIPLQIKVRSLVDGEVVERTEDFYPNTEKGVTVRLLRSSFSSGIHKYEAALSGNVASIADMSTLPVGLYQVEVFAYDDEENPYRYMARSIVEIVDATADADIDAGVEFNAETYTLEGAVFISYGGGSFEQVQADWTEADIHSKAYIKHKPTNLVEDESYVHTDNNYTNEDKSKLDSALQSETDPTVPSWAKQPSKPSYNAQEVGALPSDTPLFSGDYNDLRNKPTIPAEQIQSDWNQSDNTQKDFIKNKPTIPAAQVNADWNADSGVAQILNKPTIPDISNCIQKSPTAGLVKNDGTIDTNTYLTQNDISGKADKSEMSVVDGTGTDSDKTTIQLKSGTSATVLKSHQSLSGKQDVIDAQHKLSADLVDDTNSTNKFTNATEKQTWNNKQDALTFETAPSSSNKVATMADVPTVPNNLVVFSNDNGEGIIPSDGIHTESVNAGATISVNPDVVTVINGAVGTAAITLQVPNDNLAHVWDILMTTDSSVAITFATSNSATILYPSGFSVGASKAVEVSVIGVGTKYYLRYGEFA